MSFAWHDRDDTQCPGTAEADQLNVPTVISEGYFDSMVMSFQSICACDAREVMRTRKHWHLQSPSEYAAV